MNMTMSMNIPSRKIFQLFTASLVLTLVTVMTRRSVAEEQRRLLKS